jgi:ATPase subunit of ABC transporter with duplicated ATPase domains
MQSPKRNTTLIELHSASVFYGTFEALSGVTLSIMKGDRIGLVGSNGSGKSTLMKLFANDVLPEGLRVSPEKGSIKRAKSIRVAYLPQITEEDERISGVENGSRNAVGEIALSGGEKTKRILSELFSGEYDLYLLDEPTNNLDADGLEWLEREITKRSGTNSGAAFVIISHDRDFLDRTVNKIFSLDETSRTLQQYETTFSKYLEIREAEIEEQWKKYEAEQGEQKRLKKSAVQRVDWMRKIEQTRFNNRKLDPGEKEKPPAAYLRDKEGAMGRRARVIKDRFEQSLEDTIEKPTVKLPINLSFDETERSGEIVYEVKDVTFAYKGGNPQTFNFEAKYGERIHITGKNGSGKTTLIKLLLGELKPENGEVRIGTRVQLGYLPQESQFKSEENVIDAVCRILGKVRNDETEGLLRMTLKRFGFEEADAKKSLAVLSSGERSRLQLALMKMMQPNCIVLDEPTNHLDIESVEALEDALLEFKGTLIVVSHDKRFVENVGMTREVKLG